MIKALNIKSAPCFPQEGMEIGSFEDINFFFGPNGTGKTTISRSLGDVDRYSGTAIEWQDEGNQAEIRVYNRDYVSDTFGGTRDLDGVFLLGSESKEARRQIDILTTDDGELPKAKAKLSGLKKTRSEKAAALVAARGKLTNVAWKKRDQVPSELLQMFQGFNSSKEKFTEKLLLSGAQSSNQLSLEDLVKESKSAFDENAETISELAPAEFPDLSAHAGASLLGVELLGSKEVTLSRLIEELGNSDWVAEGRVYLARKPDMCPFCQQEAPPGLLDQLADYFDERYATQSQELGIYVEQYRQAGSGVLDQLEQLLEAESSFLDLTKLKAARSDLGVAIAENVKQLEKKVAKPSLSVAIDDLDHLVRAANEPIETANAEIRAHNSKVQNRMEAKKALVERCWEYFRVSVVAAEVGGFRASEETLQKAIDGVDQKISEENTKLGELETKLKDLEKQVVTSKETIERINALLEAVGFTNFRLAESEEIKDGYQLLRQDGTTEYETLSEGERTFITFLYFFHGLRGRSSDDESHTDLVAVVDDPISSLDSDIMFVVSQLLRQLMEDIRKKSGRVRQLVLLTHNAYFHKEVTFLRQGESEARRRFFVVRRMPNDLSSVEGFEKNPIQTAYSRLWDEIRRADQESAEASVSLQNTMRRILETYFRILGDTTYDDALSDFTGPELTICRSLLSWVNEGSHTIVEEIDYSPSENSTELYLRVFKQIFEGTGHSGHYRMMMMREHDPIALAA